MSTETKNKPVLDNEDDFGDASAFRSETSVILRFDSPMYSLYGSLRQEHVKTYILKLLLYAGLTPTGNGLAVIARLIEVLTIHPEYTPEDVIADFAKTHQASSESVTRIIEKYINIYDNDFYDRVVAITKSHPMTAKYVLCDLSVYIQVRYMSQRGNNA